MMGVSLFQPDTGLTVPRGPMISNGAGNQKEAEKRRKKTALFAFNERN